MNNDNFNAIKSQLNSLSEAELHGIISGALLEIKTRAYHEGVAFGADVNSTIEEHREVLVGLANRKSDQEIRDEVIEKAKADVLNNSGTVCIKSSKTHSATCEVEYVVNKDKRTVVALLRGIISDKIRARGITKCDPTDCFNVHIGKAIAVRRALGLEVPTEYLNAPQPTEVRVGDVVQSLMSGNIGTKVASKKGEHTLVTKGIYYTLAHSVCNVIDDSREGGEE
jgi:hypothetical protein